MKPTFFKTPSDFRAWLEQHHAKERELLVGFYKKDSGKPSITWPESVQQALCFGWIDGVRKSIDDISYTIRFTPRKSTSTWSSVNIKFVGELTKQGLMAPAGIKAFNARKEKNSGLYSYEQKNHQLNKTYEMQLRQNKKAWKFFQNEAPWYRRTASYWVMSAKKDETQMKRLKELIHDSENESRVKPLRRP